MLRRVREDVVDESSGTDVTLEFSRPANRGLALSGRWENDSISFQLRRVDESKFLLLNRGFHWTQTYPFFR